MIDQWHNVKKDAAQSCIHGVQNYSPRKGRSTNRFADEKGEIGSNYRQGPYNAVFNHEVMYLR